MLPSYGEEHLKKKEKNYFVCTWTCLDATRAETSCRRCFFY